MKTFTGRLLLFLVLLPAFAVPGRAEESHRRFFEADLDGGGRAVFFVQGNHAVSIYIFNPILELNNGTNALIATNDN